MSQASAEQPAHRPQAGRRGPARRALRAAAWGSAIGALLCWFPRTETHHHIGWPFRWVIVDPIFRPLYGETPQEHEEFVEDLWRRGRIGPVGAPVLGEPGWYWFRTPQGTVAQCSPELAVANVAIFALGLAGASLARSYFLQFVRRSEGRCVTCGYDLRGSPGQVCSECGTPLPGRGVPGESSRAPDEPPSGHV